MFHRMMTVVLEKSAKLFQLRPSETSKRAPGQKECQEYMGGGGSHFSATNIRCVVCVTPYRTVIWN